jgi:hypothetical protein
MLQVMEILAEFDANLASASKLMLTSRSMTARARSTKKLQVVSSRAKEIRRRRGEMVQASIAQIVAKGVNRTLAEALAGDLVRHLSFSDGELTPAPSRSEGGLVSPFGKWVIRHEDLQLIGHLSDGIKAAGAAGLFFWATQLGVAGSGILGGTTAIVLAAFRLFRQIYRRGISLSDVQRQIVVVLKRRRLATVDEVADELNWRGLDQKPRVWTTEEVQEQLLGLKEVRAADGEIIPLVNSDSKGRWSLRGV